MIAHRHLFWLGHDLGRLHLNIVNGNVDSAISHLIAMNVDVEGLEEELKEDYSDFKQLINNCKEDLELLKNPDQKKIESIFEPLNDESFQFVERVFEKFL